MSGGPDGCPAPAVHVVAADPDKFFVNAFIVEGERELVLIDTHFVMSSTRRVLERVAAISKPLAGVIITHPHPDHYNGLPQVLAAHPGVPVFATAATVEGIRATWEEKRRTWTPTYGDDYPTEDATPDQVVEGGAVLDLAGVELHLIDLGGVESALGNTAVHIPAADALIASDLIYNGCHPWLVEHGTARWIEQLDAVERDYGGSALIFPGHGAAGGPELLDAQRRYIAEFRVRVAAVARAGTVSPAEMAQIAAETRRGREGWPLDGLIETNISAVAQELAAR